MEKNNESKASTDRNSNKPFDCAIIGGGVMGLSIAFELSEAGQRVAVIGRSHEGSQSTHGKQASWAGAGIIPPPNRSKTAHFAEQLHRLSYDLHLDWTQRLKTKTGIDNGLRTCGGIYIARSKGESASLIANTAMFDLQQINAQLLDAKQVASLEPGLQPLSESGQLQAAVHLPDEMQIRNPRHLKALRQACEQNDVTFLSTTEKSQLEFSSVASDHNRSDHSESTEIRFDNNEVVATKVCIAAGAWSYDILKQFGVEIKVFPMRGQILLFRSESLNLTHVINEGPRYIVPRGDGHFLVGSLEEEVGFQNQPSEEGKEDLSTFASVVSPELSAGNLIDHWSGLRPATLDGFPYVGRLSHPANIFYATGHYRLGLTMSTGTARVMRQLMLDEETEIDIRGLSIERGI